MRTLGEVFDSKVLLAEQENEMRKEKNRDEA